MLIFLNFLLDICSMKKYFFSFLIFTFFIIANSKAQTGFQIGIDGSTIYNTNSNTNLFPFYPVMNYEFALVNKSQINDRLAYRLELGYVNKGASQSGGATSKSFKKYALGYANFLFALQYQLKNEWNVQLAVSPSYLVLYKVYDKGNVSNYISSTFGRYKVDVPVAIGFSKMVNTVHEFTIRVSKSNTPFATTKNYYPIPSTDKLYHANLSLIYTYFTGNHKKDDE